MQHSSNFEIVGTLIQKDELKQLQNNNQQGNRPNNLINFLVEKKTVMNGQTYSQNIPLSAFGYIAQGIANTPLGTELVIKGQIKSNRSQNGDRYYATLSASEIARIQPKQQGQYNNNQGGYQNNNQNQGYQGNNQQNGYQGNNNSQNNGYQNNQQGGYNNNQGNQHQQPPQQQNNSGDEPW